MRETPTASSNLWAVLSAHHPTPSSDTRPSFAGRKDDHVSHVVLVGNGGHARACLDAWDPAPELAPAGYLGPEPGDVLGLPWLGDDDALPRLLADGLGLAFVALGSNRVRAEVTRR